MSPCRHGEVLGRVGGEPQAERRVRWGLRDAEVLAVGEQVDIESEIESKF
jgi:hypothetical protein